MADSNKQKNFDTAPSNQVADKVSKFENIEQLKQAGQILINQYIRELSIYCLAPEILEVKATYSHDPVHWTTIRDAQGIIRISDLSGWFHGRTTYQHLIPKIKSIVHDLKERGVTEIAVRGNPQLQNVLAELCSRNKIKVANYAEEELAYPAQQNR